MSSRYTVSASAHIDAPHDRIYGIIADYHVGHASILPKPFRNLVIEQGGIGAGTIIRFEVHAYGTVTKCRAIVTEPQPGRVLVETNVEPAESPTTFTLEPAAEGGTDVTITTEAQSRNGLAGIVERWMSTRFLKKLYAEELELLRQRATRM